MVKQRYKQTEVGIIPEDWDISSVYDAGEILNGLTYSPEDVSSYGLLVLRSSNIKDNRLCFDDNVFVKREISEKQYLKENDLLICVRNGSRALIGKCTIIDKNYNATFGAFMSVLRSDMNRYINQIFQSNIIQQQIDKNCSATINQITKNDFKQFLIALPPLIEQETIAEALSDADDLIASLEKLIEKKKAIKQGAMQQILTGKKRLPGFSDEWIEKKLGDISHIKTGDKNNDQKKEGGKYPFFVRSQQVERIDTYSFEGEAILIPGEGNIGQIFHYIVGRFEWHQRVYKISNFPDNVCGKYVFFQMKNSFGKYSLQNTVKATVDSLRLYGSLFCLWNYAFRDK